MKWLNSNVCTTAFFVRSITAVVVMVTAPSTDNAATVAASKLRLGALAIHACALRCVFVTSVSAIIIEITLPALRNAASVGAPEVACFVALWTRRLFFVTSVAAVVCSVAASPIGDAAVVGFAA